MLQYRGQKDEIWNVTPLPPKNQGTQTSRDATCLVNPCTKFEVGMTILFKSFLQFSIYRQLQDPILTFIGVQFKLHLSFPEKALGDRGGAKEAEGAMALPFAAWLLFCPLPILVPRKNRKYGFLYNYNSHCFQGTHTVQSGTFNCVCVSSRGYCLIGWYLCNWVSWYRPALKPISNS